MNRIAIRCPAKINLTLDILGKRPDGYHLMEMVMQSVSLCDTLTLEVLSGREGIAFETDTDFSAGGENLAVRAGALFLERSGLSRSGLRMILKKRIPAAAGLGGGSADAAGVLYGLNRLFSRNYSLSALCEMGLEIGADVPFCLTGSTALVEGIGEKITPLAPMPDCFLVIAKPAVSSSTAAAFRRFDGAAVHSRPDTRGMIAALKKGELSAVSLQAFNVFEEVLALPGVLELRETMLSFGALAARMSGSGSSVFGIFEEETAAQNCRDAVRVAGLEAFLCKPLTSGPYRSLEKFSE